MAAEDILKFFSLSVDGRGYAGKVTNYTAPTLALAVEEMRAGGMDAAVDIEMGMEKLTDSFVLMSYDDDMLALWGVRQNAPFQHTVRGSLESPDGSTKSVIHNATGKIVSIARSTWGGGTPSLTISRSLSYYKETIDGRVVTEIDVENMIRVVNGVDQLADHRANIGL